MKEKKRRFAKSGLTKLIAICLVESPATCLEGLSRLKQEFCNYSYFVCDQEAHCNCSSILTSGNFLPKNNRKKSNLPPLFVIFNNLFHLGEIKSRALEIAFSTLMCNQFCQFKDTHLCCILCT